MHGGGLEPPHLSAAEPKATHADASGRARSVSSENPETERDGSRADDAAPPPSSAFLEPAEAALVRALEAATAAGRFDVVGALASELQARRLARENVVHIRRGRRGTR